MITSILSLALLLSSAPTDPAPGRRPIDRVAAVVNGEVITLSELVERAGFDYRRAMDVPEGEAREKARARALQSAFDLLVADKLLAAEAKTASIEVSESQIDAAIDDVKKRNNFTDEMLARALASEGMDLAGYRAKLRRDFENHLLLQAKVGNRVKVSDEDVQAYYQSHSAEFAGEDEVKLRLILVAVPTGSPPAEIERGRVAAEAIVVRLQAGEDFADLARELSQGPGAAAGGDLGWVRRGTMPAEMERAAFALTPGQLAPPLRSRAGWVIFKCEERKATKAPPLDEVKERVRERIGMQQSEAYRKQYIDDLRRDAHIELKIPELRTAGGP